MTLENLLEFRDHCRDIFWRLMMKEGNNIEAVEARYVLKMLDFGLSEPLAYIKKQRPGSYFLKLCYDGDNTLYSGVVSIIER